MSGRHRLSTVQTRVRQGDRSELAVGVVFLLGISASVVHWSGLVVGGILVGLVATSLRRALVLGGYLGLVVLVLFGLFMLNAGLLSAYLSMGQVFLASVGLGVGLPMLAAGATRGLT